MEGGGWGCLTSAVCQAVEDVAFMTETLEAAGRVDTEVVTGSVKRAFVDVCDRQKDTWLETSQTVQRDFSTPPPKKDLLSWHIFIFCVAFIVCHELQWVKSHVTTTTTTKASPEKTTSSIRCLE